MAQGECTQEAMPSSVWGIRESPLKKDNGADREGWERVQQVKGGKASPRRSSGGQGMPRSTEGCPCSRAHEWEEVPKLR